MNPAPTLCNSVNQSNLFFFWVSLVRVFVFGTRVPSVFCRQATSFCICPHFNWLFSQWCLVTCLHPFCIWRHRVVIFHRRLSETGIQRKLWESKLFCLWCQRFWTHSVLFTFEVFLLQKNLFLGIFVRSLVHCLLLRLQLLGGKKSTREMI